jgi:predicted nucleotidyltransferase
MNITYLIYSNIIKYITKRFQHFDPIKGIYLRGSVSTGDAILGKSDIDLVILIKNFSDPLQEARFLYYLSKEYLKLKKLFPILGECTMLDSEDVPVWFGTRTYRVFESKTWKKLHGNATIPDYGLKEEDILYRICWKVFEYLPQGYTRNDIKILTFLFLEITMLIFYLEGKISELIIERRQFLDLLPELDPQNIYHYKCMKKSFLSQFMLKFPLKDFVYFRLLSLLDKLYYRYFPLREYKLLPGPYVSYSAFEPFSPTYVVISSLPDEKNFQNLLRSADLKTQFVIPESVFKLYLYYKNPLACFSLKYKGKPLILKISKEWLDKFIKMRSTRREIREYPFGRLTPTEIINIVIQVQLYYETHYIAFDRMALRKEYKKQFKKWPFTEIKNIKLYYYRDFPLLWKTLNKLKAKINLR